MKFIDELIDKDNSKDPKAFCGIIGFLTVCGTAIAIHDSTSIITLAGLTAGALGINAWEINKTKKINNNPT
jgi:hypothetical protein